MIFGLAGACGKRKVETPYWVLVTVVLGAESWYSWIEKHPAVGNVTLNACEGITGQQMLEV